MIKGNGFDVVLPRPIAMQLREEYTLDLISPKSMLPYTVLSFKLRISHGKFLSIKIRED